MKTCPTCQGAGVVYTGAEVIALRKKWGYTGKAVAAEMGISPQYLSDLENDRRALNAALWQRYEKAVCRLVLAHG